MRKSKTRDDQFPMRPLGTEGTCRPNDNGYPIPQRFQDSFQSYLLTKSFTRTPRRCVGPLQTCPGPLSLIPSLSYVSSDPVSLWDPSSRVRRPLCHFFLLQTLLPRPSSRSGVFVLSGVSDGDRRRRRQVRPGGREGGVGVADDSESVNRF